MADLQMNQFKETTGIKYFYGEEANGTQARILFSLIKEFKKTNTNKEAFPSLAPIGYQKQKNESSSGD